jgi:hypothetical protein
MTVKEIHSHSNYSLFPFKRLNLHRLTNERFSLQRLRLMLGNVVFIVRGVEKCVKFNNSREILFYCHRIKTHKIPSKKCLQNVCDIIC